MIILVSDTSVLIDLERGGLLEPAFSCGLTMVVPDLLYDRELVAENGPFLKQLGLGARLLGRRYPAAGKEGCHGGEADRRPSSVAWQSCCWIASPLV
ncbi:hypothetical protein [Roseateles puraquae]|uniref:hypothetical protein n=1 Tax=Roseateles puraquae TaxID=431059 RepID=UPI0011851439|nr:hypothetical protein [Roseateles puraquae]MDG0857490.1 hypothetical protein [Roseateles puraquae]